MLICITTMDCGIASLETGYPKPGSGGPSGILKTDSQRVLAGLPSAIGLNGNDSECPVPEPATGSILPLVQ